MLRFAHIEFLWGLAAIPVFVLLFIAVSRWKRKAIDALGDKSIVTMLIPQVSFSRPWLKFILFVVAVYFQIAGEPRENSSSSHQLSINSLTKTASPLLF